MSRKDIEHYMKLPYRIEVFPDDKGEGFAAIIPDLPGCMTSAPTLAELGPMIEEAKRLWLEVALEDDIPIAEPARVDETEYSGRFVLRLPKSLHRLLSERAEREATSLNSLVSTLVSMGLGLLNNSTTQQTARREQYSSAAESAPIPWNEVVRQYAPLPEANLGFADCSYSDLPGHEIREERGKYVIQ